MSSTPTILFYICVNYGSEKLNDRPKVRQLISGRPGTRPHVSWFKFNQE